MAATFHIGAQEPAHWGSGDSAEVSEFTPAYACAHSFPCIPSPRARDQDTRGLLWFSRRTVTDGIVRLDAGVFSNTFF